MVAQVSASGRARGPFGERPAQWLGPVQEAGGGLAEDRRLRRETARPSGRALQWYIRTISGRNFSYLVYIYSVGFSERHVDTLRGSWTLLETPTTFFSTSLGCSSNYFCKSPEEREGEPYEAALLCLTDQIRVVAR